MTMLETSRYPIFRVLDTETVLGIIREQPSEKQRKAKVKVWKDSSSC